MSAILPTKSLLHFTMYFIKQQKWRFLGAQFFALAWSLDNTAWPYAFKVLLDKILAYHGDKSDVWVYLGPVLLCWAGLWLTIELMFRASGWLLTAVWPRMAQNVRMTLFDYVQQHSYDYFANHFSGNLSNKISDMTLSLQQCLHLIINLFIPALIAFMIAATIFFYISWTFATVLTAWVAVHMSICFYSAKHCSAYAHDHAETRSQLTGKIVDVFTNIANVKLFARQRFEYNYLQTYQAEERAKHQRSLVIVEKVRVVLGIVCFLMIGLFMTWLEIYSWQHNLISVTDLLMIFTATSNITVIAWLCGLELPNLFREVGICQQALALVSVPHAVVDTKAAQDLPQQLRGEIRFDQVNFNYASKNIVFHQLNLHIQAGSKVGLVGFSGSGKTTLVNLLMRFYDISQGQISIDGYDIAKVTLASLREHLTMIPQDPTLFHRSLLENIRYGKPQASDEEVVHAATLANCDEFIRDLPEGYATLVGERGVKLSGGQRQRIAIARALLKNSSILLLDEATSALDSITEEQIQQALVRLMQNRTTLVIAHRLSTLAQMDRILVFDRGQLIEDGSHQALLNADGHYAKMWRMQAGGFLPEQSQAADATL